MLLPVVFVRGTGCWDVVLIRNGSADTADRSLLWRQRAEQQESRSWYRVAWRALRRPGRVETNRETGSVHYRGATMWWRSGHVVTG